LEVTPKAALLVLSALRAVPAIPFKLTGRRSGCYVAGKRCRKPCAIWRFAFLPGNQGVFGDSGETPVRQSLPGSASSALCFVLCAGPGKRKIAVKSASKILVQALLRGPRRQSPHGAQLTKYLDLTLAGYRHQHDRSHGQRRSRRRAAAGSKPGSRRRFAFRDSAGGLVRPDHARGGRRRCGRCLGGDYDKSIAGRSSGTRWKACAGGGRKIERCRSCGPGCSGGPVEYTCGAAALFASADRSIRNDLLHIPSGCTANHARG